jgi:very-short-patch-repair endonuclease
MAPGDVRRIGPVPVTSPARTVLDAALVEPDDVLERLVAQALRRRLTTVEQLRARALAEPGRRGTGRLLGVLADGPAFDRSVAERLTLELVRRARLAEPRLNQRIGPWEVDLLWRRERVVGEFDSYRFHQDRHAFRKDRRKLAALQLEGYRVVTVIWEDLHDHREALAALLARFVAPR